MIEILPDSQQNQPPIQINLSHLVLFVIVELSKKAQSSKKRGSIMKKLIGISFILAALAVIIFSLIGYPTIDANLWSSVPIVVFVFFSVENALKKDYKSSLICSVIGFIIANASYGLLPISNGIVITAGVLACVGLSFLLPDSSKEK